MENLPVPAAHAQAAITRTKTGTMIVRVALITSDSITWRTYKHTPGCDLDRSIAAALKSCGLASAWVWGALTDTGPRKTPA